MELTPLDIKGEATIRHVNLRKEGNEDDRVPAADVKMVIATNADVLLTFSPTLRGMLYDMEGMPRYPAIPVIKWDAEIRSVDLELVRAGRAPVAYRNVKLKGFEFTPLANHGLDLTTSAQMHTSEGDADFLHALLMEPVKVTITRSADLFEGNKGAPA